MKRVIILFSLFFPFLTNAQNTMYFMNRLPQNLSLNPAFVPEAKFFLTLPGMGGISANAYNSGFNYNELDEFINNLENDSYNPDEFVNSIGDYNRFFAEAQANLFSLGFKLKEKNYISMGLTANSTANLRAASEIAYLLADLDDLNDDNFPLQVDDIDLLTTNYLTLGFTYSRIINERLTLGISPHINFNQAGVKTSQLGYRVELEEDEFDTNYNQFLLGKITLGMPVEINPEAIDGNELNTDEDLFPENWEDDITMGDLLRNKSLSVDLGATYQWKKWTFSASILNIGSTSWKNNSYQLTGSNESVLIREEDKISIGLPTKFYLGAVRQFSPKWNYGVVFNHTRYISAPVSTATVSLNGYIGKMLSTSVSYTAGYKFDNLGIGFRLRFLPGMDLYLVTDNIIQAFSYKNAYRFSAAAGINFTFGFRENASEPILPLEEEK